MLSGLDTFGSLHWPSNRAYPSTALLPTFHRPLTTFHKCSRLFTALRQARFSALFSGRRIASNEAGVCASAARRPARFSSGFGASND